MNILMIEDDLVLVKMYQTILENHGFTVDTANDGAEGLQKALEHHPDLVLLDIRLPKMDGMEVLKKLRGDSWGLAAKVIILTNLDTTDTILQDITNNQPTYYLIKSNTSPEKVLDHVKEVLSAPKKEH